MGRTPEKRRTSFPISGAPFPEPLSWKVTPWASVPVSSCRKPFPNSGLGFLGIKRVDAPGGDILVGFADYVLKVPQTALPPFQCRNRLAKDIVFGFKRTGFYLGLNAPPNTGMKLILHDCYSSACS